MKLSLKKHKGFTLLELIITLVIVAILAGIAIPSYQTQLIQARRNDGIVRLLELTTRMEHYFAENHSFAGATIHKLIPADKSPKKYYSFSLSHLSATTYTATATPIGPQLKADAQCGNLSINELGQKSITGAGRLKKCWR